jgi:hypothetical protein
VCACLDFFASTRGLDQPRERESVFVQPHYGFVFSVVVVVDMCFSTEH